jgi:hypothetical protein
MAKKIEKNILNNHLQIIKMLNNKNKLKVR